LAFVLGLVILAIASAGPNIALAGASAATLVVGTALLWRAGEPPTLLLVFFFQWLQASLAILQATFAGETLDEYYLGSGLADEATFLALAALTAMALGMRLVVGPVRRELQQQARAQTARGSSQKWFILYATFWSIGIAAQFGARSVPALAQVFLGVDTLRWAFFFMLGVVHFERGRKAGWWFPIAFVFEFALSLGGFFSSFKTVFFVTFLAAAMAGVKVSTSRVIGGLLIGIAAFGMGVVWTAVKSDYRSFASGGEMAQTVNVGYPEQMAKLGELVGQLDEEALGKATQDFLSRISYVEFFGSVLSYVPQNVPHEGGALLADAFARPFMPRALFPEKTEINDSERTRYYTGRFVSGVERGTSISIGWVGETYIDFGPWGMMLGAMAIGGFYGLIYRLLTTWRRTKGILGFGMATAVLLPVSFMETSITKAIGGVVASGLVALLLAQFVVPLVSPWLANYRRVRGRAPPPLVPGTS